MKRSLISLFLALAATGCGAPTGEAPTASPGSPAADPATVASGPSRVPQSDLAPEEYLDRHLALLNQGDPNWQEAVALLETRGDAFTLSLLPDIERGELADDGRAALARLRSRIESRRTDTDAPDVQALLERAAYADLMCNPLEGRLTDWTLKYLAARVDEPAVRQQLEGLRKAYTPRIKAKTLFGSMQARVPAYVEFLLVGADVGR